MILEVRQPRRSSRTALSLAAPTRAKASSSTPETRSSELLEVIAARPTVQVHSPDARPPGSHHRRGPRQGGARRAGRAAPRRRVPLQGRRAAGHCRSASGRAAAAARFLLRGRRALAVRPIRRLGAPTRPDTHRAASVWPSASDDAAGRGRCSSATRYLRAESAAPTCRAVTCRRCCVDPERAVQLSRRLGGLARAWRADDDREERRTNPFLT